MLSNSQKGITLYLVIVILAVVLAVAIGLSTILVSQIRMITGMGNSVKALYAADTGIEKALVPILECTKHPYNCNSLDSQISGDPLDNGSRYEIEISCCVPGESECQIQEPGTDGSCEEHCQNIDGYKGGECVATGNCTTGTQEGATGCDPDTQVCCCQEGVGICPEPLETDEGCQATYFCIRSKGVFKDVQRAIEVGVEPID